jgi:hypothetical protein
MIEDREESTQLMTVEANKLANKPAHLVARGLHDLRCRRRNSVATTLEEADAWESTLELAEELAFEFDEERYQKAKKLFDAGLKFFAADTPEQSMRRLVRHYAAKMTREALARMKPYAIRYIKELSAQQQTQTRPLSPTAQWQDLLAKFAEASEDQPTEVQCLVDFADLTVEDAVVQLERLDPEKALEIFKQENPELDLSQPLPVAQALLELLNT